MATIIINENTKKGKIILDLIKELRVGKIIEDTSNTPNQKTIDAIKDAQQGNTTKCSNFDDYLQKIK
jgi:hypothetical protein